MTPEQHKRVEELFDKLVELPTTRRAEELEIQSLPTTTRCDGR